MVWNNTAQRLALALITTAMFSGCTVMMDRESPLNKVTKDSPTVLDVYRGTDYRNEATRQSRITPQERMRERTQARPINAGDELTQRYWSAIEPMNQRFARLPNPDLVMVVFPHLAKGQYPVPGYVTVFPMYDQTQYALPGEVTQDLLQWRSDYFEAKSSAKKKGGADDR
nr:TIGR03751 family conjugal transfer lipoprotein [Alcaligenes faecalis]